MEIGSKDSGVYSISLPDGRSYIGSSVEICKRWRRHKLQLNKGNHHAKHLQNAWRKYGEGQFEFKVIELCGKESLRVREQYWMDQLKPVFNFLVTAGSWYGSKHSEESKLKMAEAGRKAQTGRKHSEESKLKRSIKLKGRKPSKQCLEATIKACTGRRLTEEHKAKIGAASRNLTEGTRAKLSAAGKGRKMSLEDRKKISESNRSRWFRKELRSGQRDFFNGA